MTIINSSNSSNSLALSNLTLSTHVLSLYNLTMYFKLPALFASLSLLVGAAFATPAPATDFVTYDRTYDSGSLSLANVACSNGANGLLTKGFTTLDSLPSFPFIGGAHAVAAWNSPNCGTCWALTFEGTTIHVLAVDTAGVGFNIALEAMDALTGGRGVELGKVSVQYHQVDASVCGL